MFLNNKTIIQTKVISGISENVLPIKNTNIKITAPKIEESLPEEVRIHANSTIGTNGKAKESFTQENWNYNKETGEIRGLLCGKCNKAIGLMDEKPENFMSAIKYVEENQKWKYR